MAYSAESFVYVRIYFVCITGVGLSVPAYLLYIDLIHIHIFTRCRNIENHHIQIQIHLQPYIKFIANRNDH